VTEEGTAFEIAPEAGFLAVPGGDYIIDGQPARSGNARIFYSFHPADDPETAPLAIFFNGGPGSSSQPLLNFNTSTWTLDPEIIGNESIALTPEPWTQHFNLLHIDAPNTGFSYTLPLEDEDTPTVIIDPDRDAGVVIRTVLRFLARHPQLEDVPLLIVGESYGGVRGTLMNRILLDYESLADGYYQDADLLTELTGSYAAMFPGSRTIGAATEWYV
jgi:carboxypeptidase C (cathepsin A)